MVQVDVCPTEIDVLIEKPVVYRAIAVRRLPQEKKPGLECWEIRNFDGNFYRILPSSYGYYPEDESFLSEGDSVFKSAGSLDLMIRQKSGARSVFQRKCGEGTRPYHPDSFYVKKHWQFYYLW